MPSKSDLKEELHQSKTMRDGLAKKIHDLRLEINRYNDRIAEIEVSLQRIGQEPRVSDHALLRYLERVMGFDLDQLREKILSNGTKEAIEAGALRVSKDGCHLLVSKEGCITTVLEQNMKIPHRSNA